MAMICHAIRCVVGLAAVAALQGGLIVSAAMPPCGRGASCADAASDGVGLLQMRGRAEDEEGGPPVGIAAPAGLPVISMDEVSRHTTKEDAWIVVNGKVIDVTRWIPIHPGGVQAICVFLGQDASDVWNMIHPPDLLERKLVPKGGQGPVLVGTLGGGSSDVAAGSGAQAAAAAAVALTAQADMHIRMQKPAGEAVAATKVDAALNPHGH